MLPWKTLRTICMVLLLVPIVHFVYLVSQEVLASLNGSTEVWKEELEAYSKQDSNSSLPERPIVVVGGRRVKLWKDLEHALHPEPILMRGLGNATVDDVLANHDQLIAYYRPKSVVFIPSNSEFHIRANKSAEDLVEDIKLLVKQNENYQVTKNFFIFTPVKTLFYTEDFEKIDTATELLNNWALSNDKVHILDANPSLLGNEGMPRARYFRGDGVNLNEHGYLRLTTLLQQHLERIESDES